MTSSLLIFLNLHVGCALSVLLHLANEEACGYACSESTTALLRPRIGQWFFILAHSSEFCECMNERAQSANNTRPGGLAALFCDSVDQRAYLRSHGAEHFSLCFSLCPHLVTHFDDTGVHVRHSGALALRPAARHVPAFLGSGIVANARERLDFAKLRQ